MSGVEPRPAATVCVLRPSPDGVEVLMVQRTRAADFMGGDWVFPGGGVDDIDRTTTAISGMTPELAGHGAAALRELAEEASVWLTVPPVDAATRSDWQPLRDEAVYRALQSSHRRFAGEELAFFAHWVTPEGLPIRFDARFFMCAVAEGTEAVADENEVYDATWISPAEALRRDRSGAWTVPFPTQRTLEVLARFPSPGEAMAYARSLDSVERIVPRVIRAEDGDVTIVLPGQPGYDS